MKSLLRLLAFGLAAVALVGGVLVPAARASADADITVTHGPRFEFDGVVNCDGYEDLVHWEAQFLVQFRQTLDASGGTHVTVIRIITQGMTGTSTTTGKHYASPGTQFGAMNIDQSFEGVVKAEGFQQIVGAGRGLVYKTRFSITSVFTNGESHVSINEWSAECV